MGPQSSYVSWWQSSFIVLRCVRVSWGHIQNTRAHTMLCTWVRYDTTLSVARTAWGFSQNSNCTFLKLWVICYIDDKTSHQTSAHWSDLEFEHLGLCVHKDICSLTHYIWTDLCRTQHIAVIPLLLPAMQYCPNQFSEWFRGHFCNHQERLIAQVEPNWGTEGWREIRGWVTANLFCTEQVTAVSTFSNAAAIWRCVQVQRLCVCVCFMYDEQSWNGVQASSAKQTKSHLNSCSQARKSRLWRGFREHPQFSRHTVFTISQPRQQCWEIMNTTSLHPSPPTQSLKAPKREIQWGMTTQHVMYITLSVSQKAGVNHRYAKLFTPHCTLYQIFYTQQWTSVQLIANVVYPRPRQNWNIWFLKSRDFI